MNGEEVYRIPAGSFIGKLSVMDNISTSISLSGVAMDNEWEDNYEIRATAESEVIELPVSVMIRLHKKHPDAYQRFMVKAMDG